MNSNSDRIGSNQINPNKIRTGIAWCLAWGEGREPKHDLKVLKAMQKALMNEGEIPGEVSDIVDAVKELEKLEKIENFPQTLNELKDLTQKHPLLWNSKIGLVYGGVTKVKQYVFEAPKLPYIRGASTRLDQINSIDIPTFFHQKLDKRYKLYVKKVNKWVEKNYPQLIDALIPELIIYSSGGNILAFCPVAYIDILANAIEKRYTERTITANSCAVGDSFRTLELCFGLLRENIQDTFWLEKYLDHYHQEFVEGIFGKVHDISKLEENFQSHKSFNELTTKLAIRFNQRRAGNDFGNRPSRRYPVMLETHPYLRRDETEKRLAITKATNIIGEPYLSETTAIKRQLGDKAKNGRIREIKGYHKEEIGEDLVCENWIEKFELFLESEPKNNTQLKDKYFAGHDPKSVKIAESLTHISKVSNGFVAYIYADGNNMGGYIQKIRTPQQYQNFSEDVDNATKYSVYQALADKLHPRKLQGIDESTSRLKNGDLIHPFEIVTIGGDDIIIIVPANKALEIAQMIGEQFEKILLKEVEIANVEIKDEYRVESINKPAELNKIHRYSWETAPASQCKLSMSSGVLITSYNTPVYYAEKLTTQLLKSAKKRAKTLKDIGYFGGTVDFLTLKAVTMISSNIEEFRQEALIKERGTTLKLYAAPYTLHELKGLIKSVRALKKAEFPKSQIYQIRSFLERGKQTAILNYRYFRVRLKPENSKLLKEDFEDSWCSAKTNGGNLAPWMFEQKEKIYETIWRELLDIYEFISKDDDSEINDETSNGINKQNIITTKTN